MPLIGYLQRRAETDEKQGESKVKEKILKIPSELNHSFFFTTETLKVEEQIAVEFNSSYPFIYEIGFYNGIEMPRPWENPESSIQLLLAKWKELRHQLETLFASREFTAAMVPMKWSIAIFIEMLFWTNNKPVFFPLEKVQQFDFKPVNVQERLEFIISRPILYHSFVQLSELINEQEKHFTKMLLLKNNVKNVQE